MSTFISAVESAQAIVQAVVLPLFFISGVFVPQNDVPSWLATIANIFPVPHLSNRLITAYDPATTAAVFSGGDLAAVAAWAAGGWSSRCSVFSWTPQGRSL